MLSIPFYAKSTIFVHFVYLIVISQREFALIVFIVLLCILRKCLVVTDF